MENTENTPNPESLLDSARSIAAILAESTKSELVSSFVGSAVMDNDFVHLSIDGSNPFHLPLLDAIQKRWGDSGFSDTYIIDSRFCDTLSLYEISGEPTRVISWSTTVVDGHNITVGRFSHFLEDYKVRIEENEYIEFADLRTALGRYIDKHPIIEDDDRDPTGWETLIAFLEQINFQLNTLSEYCYDDKVSYPELEDWEREDYDPWADPSIVGWGEDVEWRFDGDLELIDELTDSFELIDPQSTAGNIKRVGLSGGMSYADALEELGGSSDSLGSVDRMFNCGIIMKYTYDGYLGKPLDQVTPDDDDLRSILINYVSKWQTTYISHRQRSWFYLGDAFECLYGQANLCKAYTLRQQRLDIEETPLAERTQEQTSELAAISDKIREHETSAEGYISSIVPAATE
jgi:hypothetical protein